MVFARVLRLASPKAWVLALTILAGWMGVGGCHLLAARPACDTNEDCPSGYCLSSGFCSDAGPPEDPDGGSTPPDGGPPDGGPPDAGLPDGGLPDGGLPDGGLPDAGLPDGGRLDGGLRDGGPPDGGLDPDAGLLDAGPDGGFHFGPQWETPFLITGVDEAIPSGTLIPITFDHESMVDAGQSREDGADVLIGFREGEELRALPSSLAFGSTFNAPDTTMMIRTQAGLLLNTPGFGYRILTTPNEARTPPAAEPRERYLWRWRLGPHVANLAMPNDVEGFTFPASPAGESWYFMASWEQFRTSTDGMEAGRVQFLFPGGTAWPPEDEVFTRTEQPEDSRATGTLFTKVDVPPEGGLVVARFTAENVAGDPPRLRNVRMAALLLDEGVARWNADTHADLDAVFDQGGPNPYLELGRLEAPSSGDDLLWLSHGVFKRGSGFDPGLFRARGAANQVVNGKSEDETPNYAPFWEHQIGARIVDPSTAPFVIEFEGGESGMPARVRGWSHAALAVGRMGWTGNDCNEASTVLTGVSFPLNMLDPPETDLDHEYLIIATANQRYTAPFPSGGLASIELREGTTVRSSGERSAQLPLTSRPFGALLSMRTNNVPPLTMYGTNNSDQNQSIGEACLVGLRLPEVQINPGAPMMTP